MYEPSKGWRRSRRHGRDVPRIKGTRLPCSHCSKSTTGRPAPENELRPRNQRALEYFWQVQGGRPCADDALVHERHGLIALTLERIRQARQDSPLAAILGAILASRGR